MAQPDGFFLLWRRFFDHRYWREPRVFSRAEAWIDFLALAAYEAHEVVLAGETVELGRGELVASVRSLADRWKWSKSRVHRWIEDGKSANEIRDSGGTQSGTRYAIVNYDTYQNPWDTERDTDRDSNGTATGQRRDKTKEGKEGKEGNLEGAGSRKTRRAHQLPEDWQPNDKHVALAKAEGVDLKRETAKFRDHWKAKGETRKDWDATFNNWIRTAAEFRNGNRHEKPQYDVDAIAGDWR